MRAATFTTYLNVQEDPGLERAFSRQADIATSSFARIAQGAAEATRATAGLLGGKAGGTQGATAVNRAIGERATATRKVITAAADAERQSVRLASATRREADAMLVGARANSAFAGSLRTTATALNIVQGPLGPLAGRLSAVSRAVEELTGFRLGLAAFGATLFAVGRTANTYASLQARLRPYFDTQVQANAAMRDAVGIATRAKTALEPVIDVYTRLLTIQDSIGLSSSRLSRVVEIATKATSLGGGSEQAKSAALTQFGQALSGNFQGAGQEINSLKEQAPLLFKAILDGYEQANGKIGVTIGQFRKLAEAGEVSTDKVLAAVERSSVFIDQMADRIPKTLGRSSTEFGNALTVMVGRFDQTVGFTTLLASSLSLIAQNLRVITGLALGVGAAFAGIKAANLARQGIENIAAIRAQALQVKELDAAWIEDATISKRALDSQIVSLTAERTAIRANIVEIHRKTAAEAAAAEQAVVIRRQAAADAAATVVAARYSGYAVNPGTGVRQSSREAEAALTARVTELTRAEATANDIAARSKLRLAGESSKLASINRELTATYGAAAGASNTLETATANVAGRVGFLRTAGSSLVSFLGGPWGIAFAVATTALYLFATAESAAEAATRKNEDAQRSFAGAVDRTTGKIYDQVGALQRLALAKDQGDALKAGVDQNRSNINNLLGRLQRPLAFADKSPERTALIGLFNNLRAGKPGSLPALEAGLTQYGSKIRFNTNVFGQPVAGRSVGRGSLASELPELGNLARDIRVGIKGGIDSQGTQQGGTRQAAARLRIARGQAREGDRAIAFGEDTGLTVTAGGKPRTKGQLAADAQVRAAQTDLERARADLAKVRAGGKGANETDDQYVDRLAGAIQNVRNLEKAEKEARAGRSAGRAAERKAARDAVQDAKDEAAAKRDAALLELQRGNLNPKSQEFLDARIKILKTYDDEVGAIDRSAAASNSAAAQMIADAKAQEAAAASAGERRRDILGSYDEAPKALTKAADQIDDLQRFVDTAVDGVAFIGKTKDEIREISKINPLGTGIYTQEMADADAKRIQEGVRKPLADLQKEFDRGVEIATLQLQGREDEADALRQRHTLLDQGVEISEAEYRILVQNVATNQRINDLLESRNRITSLIKGTANEARDAFEQLIVDLPEKGASAGLDFVKSFQRSYLRLSARQLTEKIFAGSDEKLRALISGKSAVDTTIDKFSGSVDTLSTTSTKAETAFDRVATAAESLAQRLDGVTPGQGGFGSLISANPGQGGNSLFGALYGATQGLIASGRLNQPATTDENGDIVVTAPRAKPVVLPTSTTPSARAVFNTLGEGIFKNLDKFVDKIRGKSPTTGPDGTVTTIGGSQFFTKIGRSFGDALQGAGQGAIASGFAKALGIKQSQTGAQIGGAIGSFLPIPGGAIIGGLIGGTLGGLLKKPKSGSAGISVNQYGELGSTVATGNNAGAKGTATGLAGQVSSGLQQIADALGGKLTGTTDVRVGVYDGKLRLNDHGGAIGGVKGSGAITYGSESELIAAAIKASLEDGILTGISQASQNILRSGQDLQRALEKATAIESIPKRLLQRTDPTRYAVQQLNDEFSKLISYLKEGGASAQQFADAQKLYDLERADAVKQATAQAADAIDQFLKDMVGGSSSPLNKRTVYENAAADLAAFKSEIAGGKVVDQNDLLNAARNFQDASRTLNGSSAAFFDDFEMLRSLLQKARANAGVTDVVDLSTLPGSPFSSDEAVKAAIESLKSSSVQATNNQTETLVAAITTLTEAVRANGSSGGAAGYVRDYSTIDLLPGFNTAAL